MLTDSRRYYPAAEEEWDNLPLGFTGISWQQRHGKTPKPWLYSRLCKAVSSSRHAFAHFPHPKPSPIPNHLFSILKSHFLPIKDTISHSFSSSVSSSSHSTSPYTPKQSANHEGWLHQQSFLSNHSIFLFLKIKKKFLLKSWNQKKAKQLFTTQESESLLSSPFPRSTEIKSCNYMALSGWSKACLSTVR